MAHLKLNTAQWLQLGKKLGYIKKAQEEGAGLQEGLGDATTDMPEMPGSAPIKAPGFPEASDPGTYTIPWDLKMMYWLGSDDYSYGDSRKTYTSIQDIPDNVVPYLDMGLRNLRRPMNVGDWAGREFSSGRPFAALKRGNGTTCVEMQRDKFNSLYPDMKQVWTAGGLRLQSGMEDIFDTLNIGMSLQEFLSRKMGEYPVPYDYDLEGEEEKAQEEAWNKWRDEQEQAGKIEDRYYYIYFDYISFTPHPEKAKFTPYGHCK